MRSTGRWTEGSYMEKHGNFYYMPLCSANFFGKDLRGGGLCNLPKSFLGPFTKVAKYPCCKRTHRARRHRDRNWALYAHRHSQSALPVYHGRTETTNLTNEWYSSGPHRHPTRRETGGPLDRIRIYRKSLLKLSGADCTAFHGSLFPWFPYIPRPDEN